MAHPYAQHRPGREKAEKLCRADGGPTLDPETRNPGHILVGHQAGSVPYGDATARDAQNLADMKALRASIEQGKIKKRAEGGPVNPAKAEVRSPPSPSMSDDELVKTITDNYAAQDAKIPAGKRMGNRQLGLKQLRGY